MHNDGVGVLRGAELIHRLLQDVNLADSRFKSDHLDFEFFSQSFADCIDKCTVYHFDERIRCILIGLH